MPTPPRIRPAVPDDAPALAELSTQLGYPSAATEVRRRLSELESPEHGVLVAEADGVVVGFVDVHVARTIEADPLGEIGGLSVLEGHRRGGIGAGLMAAAAAWTRERGLSRMWVRVRRTRVGSHDFYVSIGCRVVKDQRIYEYPM